MIHAYNINYLKDSMRNLGEMVDYAVNECKIDIEDFWRMFIDSGIAESFGDGNPKYLCGMSGIELAIKVLDTFHIYSDFSKDNNKYDLSPEYWCGWIIAYYQWSINTSFKKINDRLPIREVLKLYHPLHEASEEKFVETANRIIRVNSYVTNLQRLRKESGYSQRTLAENAQVNIRMIQQYENKSKDINKAAVITVASLAKALGCKIEDLLELPIA